MGLQNLFPSQIGFFTAFVVVMLQKVENYFKGDHKMKKAIYLQLLLIPSIVIASEVPDKLDARLKLLMNIEKQDHSRLSKRNVLGTDSKMLNVFIRGNAVIIKPQVESLGGTVNTVAGEILTAQIPKTAVFELARLNAVHRIKMANKLKCKNDMATTHIRADLAHRGIAPLQNPIRGNDVIVGIIDSGIDYTHEDFRLPEDPAKSKILLIWDQNDQNGEKPAGFSYGSEWTRGQIEDEIDGAPAQVVTHEDPEAHGTHVAATAAGNLGIAPSADIIFVALDFNASTSVLDAANYIYQKAAELGKPAVINGSFGTHFGPHDGSSEESLGLDNLVNAAPGRVFCAAAGNEGSDYIHWGGFELQDAEKWTYYYSYYYDEINAVAYTDLYIILEDQYLNSLSFSFAADSSRTEGAYSEPFPIRKVGQTGWKTAGDMIDEGFYESTLLYGNNNPAGTIYIETASLGNNKTEIYVYIEDDIELNTNGDIASGLDLWRFYVKGKGIFHAWGEGVGSIPDPSSSGIQVDSTFLPTDNDFSVGIPAAAHEVIAVGATVNRNSWIDRFGAIEQFNGIVGNLASFSSLGPTVDMRIKPEIVAPGHFVASALSSQTEDTEFEISDGKHIVFSGTSMSSPVATGAVALLLEKYPNYNNAQVREMIFNTTNKDEFAQAPGNLPNYLWGYGKLDIFAALTTNVATEVVDNNNTSITTFSLAQNYPNPFNPSTVIAYSLPQAADVQVTVFNLLGQKIRTLVNSTQSAGEKHTHWNGLNEIGQQVPGGVYFFKIVAKSEDVEFTDIKKGIMLK